MLVGKSESVLYSLPLWCEKNLVRTHSTAYSIQWMEGVCGVVAQEAQEAMICGRAKDR